MMISLKIIESDQLVLLWTFFAVTEVMWFEVIADSRRPFEPKLVRFESKSILLQPQIRKSWDSMENANKKRK